MRNQRPTMSEGHTIKTTHWQTEFLEGRFYERYVLGQHLLKVPPPLSDVPQHCKTKPITQEQQRISKIHKREKTKNTTLAFEFLFLTQPGISLRTSPWKPCVGIRVYEQLHLEQVPDLLGVEHQNALKQHHVCWVHRDKLLLPAMRPHGKQTLRDSPDSTWQINLELNPGSENRNVSDRALAAIT